MTISLIAFLTVKQEGNSRDVELSGKAKAGLNWLLKKLANLGIEGAAQYQGSEWQGLLQEQVAEQLNKSRDCKKEIYFSLRHMLLPVEAPPQPDKIPKPDKRPNKPVVSLITADKAATEAVQLMRLMLDNSASDDVINKLSVPFCAGSILPTSDELRSYLDSKSTVANLGRVFVSVARVEVIANVELRGYGIERAIHPCKSIISPLDYIVTLISEFRDLGGMKRVSKLIVDRQSGLIK